MDLAVQGRRHKMNTKLLHNYKLHHEGKGWTTWAQREWGMVQFHQYFCNSILPLELLKNKKVGDLQQCHLTVM